MDKCPTYELLRGALGLRRKLAVFVKNPTPIPIPHSETEPQHVVTDSTLSLRAQKTAQNSQRERRSLSTELATRGSSLSRHVGVLFLRVGWGSVWGSSRRLQVFYVIPGSRVIVHMYTYQVNAFILDRKIISQQLTVSFEIVSSFEWQFNFS